MTFKATIYQEQLKAGKNEWFNKTANHRRFSHYFPNSCPTSLRSKTVGLSLPFQLFIRICWQKIHWKYLNQAFIIESGNGPLFLLFFPKRIILSDLEGCHQTRKKIDNTSCPRSVDTTHRTVDVDDLCDGVIVIVWFGERRS